jgi:hypothetical protein
MAITISTTTAAAAAAKSGGSVLAALGFGDLGGVLHLQHHL